MPGVYVEIRDKLLKKRWRARIKGRRIMIGRSAACHLRLQTDLCSRVHAVLKLEDGSWTVEDLESSNGTFLNEQRIQKADIRAGDEIRIAPKGLKIVLLDLDCGSDSKSDPKEKRKVVKQKQPKPPKEPKRRAAKRAASAAAGPGAAAALSGGRWRWLLPLVGLLFGLAVGWDLPSRVHAGFPYREVLAPVTLLIRGVAKVFPPVLAEIGPFLYRALLGSWYLLIGFSLARPVRRWKLLLLLAVLQAAAALLV